MEILKNLMTRTKVLVIVLIFTIVLGTVSWAGLNALSQFNDYLNTMADVVSTKQNYSQRLRANLIAMHRAEKNMILANTQEDMEAFEKSFNDYKNLYLEIYAKYLPLATDKEKNLLTNIKTDFYYYLLEYGKVRNLTFENANEKAIELSTTSGRAKVDAVEEALMKLSDFADENMTKTSQKTDEDYASTRNFVLAFSIIGFIAALAFALIVIGIITNSLNIFQQGLSSFFAFLNREISEIEPIKLDSKDEFGVMASVINENITKTQKKMELDKKLIDEQNWIKDSVITLNSTLQSQDSTRKIMDTAISLISRTIDAGMGAVYLWDKETQRLKLQATYAYVNRNNLSHEFKLGEGVVGQVALEKKPIKLNDIKQDSHVISTATTQEAPLNTYTYPLVYKDELLGVIELASYQLIDQTKQDYFNASVDSLSAMIYAAIQSDMTLVALEQARALTEELEESSQKLAVQNEELEEQTAKMEEANQELEASKQELENQKSELQSAQKEIEQRSKALEDTNRYKSEFLANMSHELRTPLNSINILSSIMNKNGDGNLTLKQVEQAKTINQAGKDLLQLINDILDLSKIEAKMMSVNLSEVHIEALLDDTFGMFEPIADEKGVSLNLDVDNDLQKMIYTDKEKLKQIVKNFISNALKFTDAHGRVTVRASFSDDKKLPIKLSVTDTGIGIAKDKIGTIFEAFRQADGSTSRKYGGTGLGLSISKELSILLGGKIEVASVEGEGSTFSLFLPKEFDARRIDRDLVDIIKDFDDEKSQVSIKSLRSDAIVKDDKNNIQLKDRVLLVIEDDIRFANIVKDEANKIGLKAIICINGNEALALAKEYKPIGIILDMNLPVMDGWDVLKQLKEDVATRHIPVKIISVDEPNIATKRLGAIEYIQKPVEPEQLSGALHKLMAKGDKKQKELLIVEDNDVLREELSELLGSNDSDVTVVAVATGEEAIIQAKEIEFDCAIIDMGLPDMSGFKLLEKIKKLNCNLPIIIYTGREFSADELKVLREYSSSIVLKTAESEARLMDETTLFMHRIHTNLNERQRTLLHKSLQVDSVLLDKKILVVDDDVMNIFSLNAIFESIGVSMISANNGLEAIEKLKEHDDIDIVLMDIMMPVMNGYEAMQKIRENQKYKNLPIIALTAKAQKEDRQKCIDSGASDYMSKPIDQDQLLQLIKVWLKKSR